MKRLMTFFAVVSLIAILWNTAAPIPAVAQPGRLNAQVVPSSGDCRFGATFAYWGSMPNESITRYDLPLLGTGYYLDWKAARSPSVPNFIRYLPVLHVDDASFPTTLAKLPALVKANPGLTWIIGNEPEDRSQDNVSPETYAERYYAFAQIIRTDPTAKLGFGTVAMVTTLRIYYLQFAWVRLEQLARAKNPNEGASDLIDIWMPHNFILNEQGGTDENGNPFWGSGIPYGFETRVPTIPWQTLQMPITDFNDLFNFSIFRDRMVRFRQWMQAMGEQDKPLWLTEYGQLAPSLSPPGVIYFTVTEAVTSGYRAQTMDWMLTATDPNVGLPGDENRLVQKFFWYSINDSMTHFGGTLVNPDTLQFTRVGEDMFNYIPPAGSIKTVPPDIYPLFVTPLITGANPALHQMNYRLTVRVRNALLADHFVDVRATVKDGTATLGTQTGKTARCGGDAVFTFNLTNISSSAPKTVCVDVQPITLTDVAPGNNQLCVVLPTSPTPMYLPLVSR